ncbi:hypothetical protein GXW78_12725 [Roseomonas terrae]|uniref:Uncharacterized protein n=1 Tax=Neoroseomonas terrae TaxID=424799 RepID=A0ABS5EHL8_9PROT|nr:hypothetical protein [Neoroseomonas terrae]MBR0650531.1 hypothetical protein [Neoroseomonas terrae]
MAGWIASPPNWAHGIYDFGLVYNEQTGWHATLQCHITVCKEDSKSGANVHISFYMTQGQQISVYIPGNSWKKIFFKPDANGDLYDDGGPGAPFIRGMPCYDVIQTRAFSCFYEKYPNMKKQAPLEINDASKWPSL